MQTPPKSKGNIPELHELPKMEALRVLVHSQLRIATAGPNPRYTYKKLALLSNLTPPTVSRIASEVTNRTHILTILKLAPYIGINASFTVDKDW